MIKISDYIFDYLAKAGKADTVFMLPGGACMHLVDSLGRSEKLKYVCMLHEQAATIAADAYAQNINDFGIALVTAGPGAINALTGVAGAFIDSTPMIVLSGQAKRADMVNGRGVRQMGIQEVDIEHIAKPVTKYAKCLKDENNVPYELEKAVWLATHGRRGPVWLDVPLDVQGAYVDLEKCRHFIPEPAQKIDYDAAAHKILTALQKAKRPAVYVGNGVRAGGGVADFVALAEKLQIPVLTSWKAADFLPENHPLYVGRPGIIASRGANFVQQTCDCLLILGTRLDLCQTGFDSAHFAPLAKKMMVDIDETEIDKLDCPVEKYVMDAATLVRAMLASDFAPLSCGEFLKKAKDWQKKYPVILPEYCRENGNNVTLYHLIKELADVIESGDVFVPGSSGACAEVTMQAYPVKTGVRVQNTPGLGSMGFGLPACMGACLASGKKRTFCVIGDGGLQHNIQELETLRRLNLPVKLFVLNNGGYGSISGMQKARFDGRYVACDAQSGLTLPDLKKIAFAYGLEYVKIDSPALLKERLAYAAAQETPVVVEVMIDTVPTAPRQASQMGENGEMIPMPMENLTPFLPVGELAENLKV